MGFELAIRPEMAWEGKLYVIGHVLYQRPFLRLLLFSVGLCYHFPLIIVQMLPFKRKLFRGQDYPGMFGLTNTVVTILIHECIHKGRVG